MARSPKRTGGDGIYYLGKDRKTGKDKWKLYVHVGNNRRITRTVIGSRRDAERLKRDLEGLEKGARRRVPSGTEKFSDWLDHWGENVLVPRSNLKPGEPGRLKYNTLRSYRSVIEVHLKPELGHLKLYEVTADKIDAYYRKKQSEGLSWSSLAYHRAVLRQALAAAKRQGKVTRNEALDTELKPTQGEPAWTIWTPEQADTFLDLARDTRFYALFYLLIHTGMRLGEALALRWEDIEQLGPDEGVIHVRRTLVKPGNNPVFDTPKSKNGIREVFIDGETLGVLAEHRVKQEMLKAMEGPRYRDQGLVFTLLNGNPVDASKLNSRVFKKLIEKTHEPGYEGEPLPKCRIHDLRHFHATMLAGANVNPKVIQNRLGHSTFAFTMQRYVHKNRNEQKEALAVYRAYVGNKKEEGRS